MFKSILVSLLLVLSCCLSGCESSSFTTTSSLQATTNSLTWKEPTPLVSPKVINFRHFTVKLPRGYNAGILRKGELCLQHQPLTPRNLQRLLPSQSSVESIVTDGLVNQGFLVSPPTPTSQKKRSSVDYFLNLTIIDFNANICQMKTGVWLFKLGYFSGDIALRVQFTLTDVKGKVLIQDTLYQQSTYQDADKDYTPQSLTEAMLTQLTAEWLTTIVNRKTLLSLNNVNHLSSQKQGK